MVLHGLEQRVHSLLAEVVLALAHGERVGLVDEEHAAERLVDDLLRARGGLSHIAAHEAGAVHFHQLPGAEHSQRAVDVGEQARDGGLAGAGVAEEHHVLGDVGGLHAQVRAHLLHLDEVHHDVDLMLHAGEADEGAELGEQRVQLVRVLGRSDLDGGLDHLIALLRARPPHGVLLEHGLHALHVGGEALGHVARDIGLAQRHDRLAEHAERVVEDGRALPLERVGRELPARVGEHGVLEREGRLLGGRGVEGAALELLDDRRVLRESERRGHELHLVGRDHAVALHEVAAEGHEVVAQEVPEAAPFGADVAHVGLRERLADLVRAGEQGVEVELFHGLLPHLPDVRRIADRRLAAVAHDGHAEHLLVLEQDVLQHGGGRVLHEGHGVGVLGLLVDERRDAADSLSHRAQLALRDALLGEVDVLESDAAFLEPALRLARVAALLGAEDLDVHSVTFPAALRKGLAVYPGAAAQLIETIGDGFVEVVVLYLGDVEEAVLLFGAGEEVDEGLILAVLGIIVGGECDVGIALVFEGSNDLEFLAVPILELEGDGLDILVVELVIHGCSNLRCDGHG